MVRPVKAAPTVKGRISPTELRSLITVMRHMGALDVASGDTRIILDPNWRGETPSVDPRIAPDALRPIVPQKNTVAEVRADAEDEELLFASVGARVT